MDFENNNLKDFIFVNKNFIPNQLCDFIITKSQQYEWQKHKWYGVDPKPEVSQNSSYKYVEGDDKEFDRAILDKSLSFQIKPYLQKSVTLYKQKFNIFSPIKFYSDIGVNRYHTGSRMKSHCDHIHSLFDGNAKGIPILSLVGLLNDDFVGGEFVFWKNYKINLEKGDVLIFPSLFLYSHGVQEVLQGTRYSFVCWSW